MDYQDAFPDLAGVLLEESWVLEATAASEGLSLRLDAVLTPTHRLYESPKPGEQHCYRPAWLTVKGTRDVRLSGAAPALDATGTQDFGQVDRFEFDAQQAAWVLEGEWGHALAATPVVSVRFI